MILLLANKKYVEVVSLLVILLVVMEYWQFHDQKLNLWCMSLNPLPPKLSKISLNSNNNSNNK